MRRLEEKHGDAVFYRGHKYVNLITASATMVEAWIKHPRDWRKLPVPTACTYLVNPFLRRLGKYVA